MYKEHLSSLLIYIKTPLRYFKYKFSLLQYIKFGSNKISNSLTKLGWMKIDNDKMDKEDKKIFYEIINSYEKFKNNLESVKKDLYSKEFELNNSDNKYFRSSITHIFDKDLLIKFANNKHILSKITDCFGFKPEISNISCWIDKPSSHKESVTQLFHRDPDDLKVIKLFLYLNDVDVNNGPFTYVEKSHLSPWKIANVSGRANEEEINRIYPENNIIKFTEPKNTIILADTKGYHKGTILKKDKRVLLNVVYVSKHSYTLKNKINFY
tara:strand:+ start:217 stop:1017 length:801 start_codon:yes stop_codon:yes gene_type:complete